MNNLFKNAKFLKIVYMALGIISAVIVISSLFFMTQYRFLRVNYNVTAGVRVYESSAKLNKADQHYLFDFINDLGNRAYEDEGMTETQAIIDNNSIFQTFLEADSSSTSGYKLLDKETITNGWFTQEIYTLKQDYFKALDSFRTDLDGFNDLILIYGIVSLIVFACLLVLSNHNRKIYYKANLIGGVLLPLVNIVFVVVLIVKSFGLMASINDPTNNAIYNIVAAIQDTSVGPANVYVAGSEETNLAQINNIINAFKINSTTLVMYVIFFGVTALYNIFLIVVAVMKYKATAQERNDVLEKARLAGEKA